MGNGALPAVVRLTRLHALLVAGALGIAPALQAQTPTGQAVERAQLLRNEPALRDDSSPSSSSSDEERAPESPNDPDLGEQAILKRQEAYRPFSVSASLPIFYTTNVALSRNHERGDAIFAPAVGFTYAPKLTPTLYATFSVGQQEFYYDRFDGLDFGSFDARAGLTYTLPKLHDLSLHAEYAYNRLTASNSFDDFFSSHGLGFNADLPFRIGRAQQVSVGLDANLNIHSEPSEPGRHDFGAYVGYSVNLTRALTLNAVGRLAVRDYTDTDRVDVSEVFSLAATYRLSKWFSLAATTTLAHNDSNHDVFNYDVANIGGALAFSYRF
ncbi:MAG: outer membrane beta-barrel protein [Verrucomicrobiota bacterium]|nr:outer membrane beta-barrel protein [Verrucomicrobiota bacterium]